MRPFAARFESIDLRPHWLALATLVCGMASARIVNLVGDVYLGELLIIQLGILVFVIGRDRKMLALPAFGVFLQAAVLMLAGYLLSDLYRDTHPAQFLRGWARVILLVLDFLALAVLVAHDKRNLWWFVLGMAVGGLVQLLVRGVPMLSPYGWKFGYSTPILYLVATLSCFVPLRVSSAAFAALGVFNIFMDFRILGGVSLLVAAILWVRADGPISLRGDRLFRLAAAGMVAATLLGASLFITDEDYGRRREQSQVGRDAGISVALWALAESPLIGFGSWPTDPRLVDLFSKGLAGDEGQAAGGVKVRVFTAHSQVLQAWVEGGFLGVIFWLIYGYWLLRCAAYCAVSRQADAYLPIFLPFLFYNFWHLLMSPFSGPTRVPIAVGLAIICICAAELRERRLVAAPARREGNKFAPRPVARG